MTVQYPSAIITWVDRVDNVDYNYAGDINSAIAEIQGIATDLVGVGGTAGGLAQGGASFYARWTAGHNTSGTHKAITAPTSVDTINGIIINAGAITMNGALTGVTNINASGSITATFVGNITGNVTGNADTATNGVVTTGSYSNPAWITALAGSKITGDFAGNAVTSTNHTATYQHDQAVKVGSSPTFAGLTLSGLTASQAIVTDGSKALASLAYAAGATGNTVVVRDGNADITANGFTTGGGVLKWKIMTGTLDGDGKFAHGLTTTSILSISMWCKYDSDSWVSNGGSGGYALVPYLDNNDGYVRCGGSSWAGKDYRCVIFYA